jgi:hypothetical protein
LISLLDNFIFLCGFLVWYPLQKINDWHYHYTIQWNVPIKKQQGTKYFSLKAGSFLYRYLKFGSSGLEKFSAEDKFPVFTGSVQERILCATLWWTLLICVPTVFQAWLLENVTFISRPSLWQSMPFNPHLFLFSNFVWYTSVSWYLLQSGGCCLSRLKIEEVRS